MTLLTGTVVFQTLNWLHVSLLSTCTYGHGHRSPINAVGMFGDGISLECNMNATHGIKWEYMAPGSTLERPVPGRHRPATTSRLIIEDLQLSDAGMYVCKSPKYPVEFTKALSYVVVLAHSPVCTVNLTDDVVKEGDMAKLTCWIHYAGVPEAHMNVTWTRSDGTVLTTMMLNHTGDTISSASLSVQVPVRPPHLEPHKCQVTFTTTRGYKDLASNDPDSTRARCETPTTFVRYLKTPASSPGNEILSSGSCNCTSRGSCASPVQDVERQENVSKADSTFLLCIATTALIGVLVAGCTCILGLLIHVRRIVSQVLDECRAVFPEGLANYRRKSSGIGTRQVDGSLRSSSASVEDPDKGASRSKSDSGEYVDNLNNEELTSDRDTGTDAPDYKNQCTEVSVETETESPTPDSSPTLSQSHSSCVTIQNSSGLSELVTNRSGDQTYEDQDEPREVSLHPEMERSMFGLLEDVGTTALELGHVTGMGGPPEISLHPSLDTADESMDATHVHNNFLSTQEDGVTHDEYLNVSPAFEMAAGHSETVSLLPRSDTESSV